MSLEIALHELKFTYAPGEVVSGVVAWSVEAAPTSAELRLFWYTEGKGTQDLLVVATQTFADPQRQDRRELQLNVPVDGPLSFSGTFISLLWALELVLEPGTRAQRLEILVTNDGREIRLKRLPEENPKARAAP